MNGGSPPAAPEMSTRIINVLDPSVVGDYLATPSGERAILKGQVNGRVVVDVTA